MINARSYQYILMLIVILSQKPSIEKSSNNVTKLPKLIKIAISIKRSGSKVAYYRNSLATFNIIIKLQFDIEKYPGPQILSPKCSEGKKTVT